MTFRISYDVAGAHTHMRVWVQPPGQMTSALTGKLVMKNEEFTVFRALMEKAGVELEEEL